MEKLTIHDLPKTRKSTTNKLEKIGIQTLQDLLLWSPNRLAEEADMGKGTAERVIEKARTLLQEKTDAFKLKKAERMEKMEKVQKLTTGSDDLDDILHGGYCCGEVTELYGEAGSGKSQCAFTSMVTAFLPEEKGGMRKEGEDITDMTVVLIDTEHTFDPGRIEAIAKERGFSDAEADQILEATRIRKPKSAWGQLKLIKRAYDFTRDLETRLVVVDSLIKLARMDYEGRGELYERQRVLARMVDNLRKVAEARDIPVIATNQVVASPDQTFTNIPKDTGGHMVAHNVDTRLQLFRSKSKKRTVKIVDSNWLPPAKCKIKITEEKGIA